MEAYTSFAQVYDLFMDNVPYDDWCGYLIRKLKSEGIHDGLILDLGCGTGEMTIRLAKEGYDMIGIDLSDQMLQIAREKQENMLPDADILYLMQDMCDFELYGTVRAIICSCDSLNYILEEEDLLQVFKLVNNYLDPQGLFLFDMNTFYKYRNLLGDNTIAENREKSAFIWENSWYEEEQINEYDLTLFVEDPSEPDTFHRFTELHTQRAYEPELVIRLLKEAGLIPLQTLEAYTDNAPGETNDRLMFIARENGKCKT